MRQFLLGTALLNMGEEEKALDLFISAAAGVPQVKLISSILLRKCAVYTLTVCKIL